ncbi:DUF1499 domain-containing protein [Chthonobacter rhizosphaerae]|uniref:DUF1499 domain-containing protein n=1 Tax=Chthonobacter rhizosphaerae TaxID=2735553 RepID=UPI0015EE71D0|nr:DUF1499 domain-containing protein [Chthonobacter rhizosphaerae]
MSSLRFLAVTIALLATLFGAVAAGAVAYGREALWEDLFGPPDLGAYSFDKPTRTGKLNDALACPVGTCADAGTVLDTQVFRVEPATLYAVLREELLDTFRVRIVEDDPAQGRLRAVIFTPLMRFPDTFSAEVRSPSPGLSTIYLYSRSQIGHADLGTNEERVRTVLRHLRWTLPRVGPDGALVPARKDQQPNADAAPDRAPGVANPDAPPSAAAPAAPSSIAPARATGGMSGEPPGAPVATPKPGSSDPTG